MSVRKRQADSPFFQKLILPEEAAVEVRHAALRIDLEGSWPTAERPAGRADRAGQPTVQDAPEPRPALQQGVAGCRHNALGQEPRPAQIGRGGLGVGVLARPEMPVGHDQVEIGGAGDCGQLVRWRTSNCGQLVRWRTTGPILLSTSSL
jgi:hypothetical protein